VGRAFIATSSDDAVRIVLSSSSLARRLSLHRLWLPQLQSFVAPATAGIRASVAASFCEAAANQIWFHTNSEHRLSAGLFFDFRILFRLFLAMRIDRKVSTLNPPETSRPFGC
jgi:hypothetical protein